MVITLSNGRKVDTESELTPEERHIVQKLYAWASVVDNAAQFREKKKEAIQTGWNNSGPVTQRDILRLIIADLEKSVVKRTK
ncbi:MAG: hypothetical protein R6T92_03860 [Desulfosalsimonadaceae bacterium]